MVRRTQSRGLGGSRVYKWPSGAGKTEIQVETPGAEIREALGEQSWKQLRQMHKESRRSDKAFLSHVGLWLSKVLSEAVEGIRVYPGFPTIFRGLSEFFVGDLMGKALWKLVENAQRFPRRGGRVLCVHGPSASTGLVRVRQNGPRGGGLRTGPPASSDCGRPVNDKCSHQHRRSVQAERSSYPGKTVISGTYAIWETRI